MTGSTMKRSLRRSATLLGATRLVKALCRPAFGLRATEATVLCYHDVRDPAVPGTVGVEAFRRQAAILAAEYEVVPLTAIVERVLGGGDGSPRLVAISFDDGRLGAVEIAAPILRELGLPFTIFAIRDWSASPTPAGEAASLDGILQALGPDGLLGAHGVVHDRPMTELDDDALRREMRGSMAMLAESGVPEGARLFCYPWARHDRRVETACRESGFDAAFGGEWRRHHHPADRHRIGRVTVDFDDDDRTFRAKLSGGRDFQAAFVSIRAGSRGRWGRE